MENLEFWKIFFATKILKYPHGCGEKDHDRISTCCLSYLHGFVSLYSSNEVKWDAFPIGSAENGVENGAFSIGLGGSSRIFVIFTPILWEMIWFDEHIFRMGGLTFGSPCLAAPEKLEFLRLKVRAQKDWNYRRSLGELYREYYKTNHPRGTRNFSQWPTNTDVSAYESVPGWSQGFLDALVSGGTSPPALCDLNDGRQF